MENSVKFIILIPVYNSEKYLKNCLESILSQSYSNWEAHIIDDDSEDTSFNIMKDFSKIDKRFKVYKNTTNQGPGVTRNKAINYATGNYTNQSKRSYIVFVDSDDWIGQNYFQSLEKEISKGDPDLIFVDVIQEDEKGNQIKYQKMSNYKNVKKDEILRLQMTGKLPWGGVRKVVKSNLIIENNIRYSNDVIGEEAIYSFKVLYYAKEISFNENEYYHYVIHRNSQSSAFDENPYGKIVKKLEVLLKEMNIYENYKKTHASFAFTALILSIYRMTEYYGIFRAYSFAKNAIKEHKDLYNFNLDKGSLEKKLLLILPFAERNLVAPIVLISKMKTIFSKKR